MTTIIPKNLIIASTTKSREIVEDLNVIASTYTGRRLIEKISRNKHSITIYDGKQINFCMPHGFDAYVKGKGCSSSIFLDYESIPKLCGTSLDKPIICPSWVLLAHELIHGYHNQCGKNYLISYEINRKIWGNYEEYHTIVGVPSKKADRKFPKVTENALRNEHQLKERLGHLSFHKLTNKKTAQLFKKELKRYWRIKHRSAL